MSAADGAAALRAEAPSAAPALPFDWPVDEAVDRFVVTPSNADAVRHLASPDRWSLPASVLAGPRQSGRSLLARVFHRNTGGRVIDDADRADERRLFDAWNDAQATRVPLLLVAERAPPGWRVSLPDLASRLAATPVATITPPDDALVGQLVAHVLERRGVAVAPEVLAYIVPRAPRTHHMIVALADALDAASLAERRPITVPLVRRVLGLIDADGEAR